MQFAMLVFFELDSNKLRKRCEELEKENATLIRESKLCTFGIDQSEGLKESLSKMREKNAKLGNEMKEFKKKYFLQQEENFHLKLEIEKLEFLLVIQCFVDTNLLRLIAKKKRA